MVRSAMPFPYWQAFLLNLAVEFAVVLVALGFRRPAAVLGVVTLLNVLTHPALWFGLPLVRVVWWQKFLVAEAVVLALETSLAAVFLTRFGFRRRQAILAVGAANLVTLSLTFYV